MENAWLALFRFIDFWLGLPYLERSEVEIKLMEIKQDPRLPGGDIDTEYVTEVSQGALPAVTYHGVVAQGAAGMSP